MPAHIDGEIQHAEVADMSAAQLKRHIKAQHQRDQKQARAERKLARHLMRKRRAQHLRQRALRIVLVGCLASVFTAALLGTLWAMGLFDPLLDQADGLKAQIQGIVDDPSKAVVTAGAFIMSNITIYALLFEDQR